MLHLTKPCCIVHHADEASVTLSGVNGRVQYRITGGDIDRHFAVDLETGGITVAKQLDRETQAHYNLAIEALDKASDPRDRLSSTAVV